MSKKTDSRSAAAWATFRERVTALGGEVIETEWLGSSQPHRVRCPEGHENRPYPCHVARGIGICRTCAGLDPRVSEAAFRAKVAGLGGIVLEPVWLGALAPHRVQCAAGHECKPRPNDVRRGRGICRACAGKDPAAAESAFRAAIADLGGAVVEPVWLGKGRPHRVRCAEGHESNPHPTSVQQGQGFCRACARLDPATAEKDFRARVAALGGVVLEPAWLGSRKPHRVRCAEGHETSPRPNSVQQGAGICRICAGMAWDAFYVVVNKDARRLKFGITSGDPRGRIGKHRALGYRTTVRALVGLPGTVAPDMERLVISTLRLAGEEPESGREHFGLHVLGTVLDIVDNYPIPTHRATQALAASAEVCQGVDGWEKC